MSVPYVGNYYKLIKIPDHPLSTKRGMVRRNRAVLYEKIGPGFHPCHWCQKALRWVIGIEGKRPVLDAILADHLDGVISNDHPANLVPACHGCNSLRQRGWRVQGGDLFVVDERGARIRAAEIVCLNCQEKFIARPRKGSKYERKFCSKSCSGSYNSTMKKIEQEVNA